MNESTHREVLENLRDGVLVVGTGGTIHTVNPTARRILDLHDDVSGIVFAEAFLIQEGLDEFTQLVMDVCANRTKIGRSVITIETGGKKRSLSVATSYLLRNRKIVSVIVVFSDVTELQALREAEASQHTQLQKAYRDIEERNADLAIALRKVRTGQTLGGLIAMIILAAAGVWSYQSFSLFSSEEAPEGTIPNSENHHVSRTQTVVSTITLGGKLSPWRVAPLRSEIDGALTRVLVETGQEVVKGQTILEIDQRTTRAQLAAKKQQLTAARETLGELEDWNNSRVIVDARRNWTKARLAFETARTSINRDRFLYKEGLMSESAYADAERTFKSAELDYAAATEIFDKTMERTSSEALEIARIDVENKTMELQRIAQAMHRTKITAPFSGIILPASNVAGTPTPGVQIRAGTDLLRIADFSRVSITVNANESDIVKLKEGQEVTVTGNAFRDLRLKGQLVHVSSRASSEHDSSFRVRALLDPLQEPQMAKIRMGMNALVQIVTYKKEAAIVVPIHAVSSWSGEHHVIVVDPNTHEETLRKVRIGPTTYDSVEIVTGLSAGETVLVH